MPDSRLHRGPHPEDARLFAAEVVPTLRKAVEDLSWLLSRGYASVSALKIVGDRYQLEQRQRTAVARCACADHSRGQRAMTCRDINDLAGRTLWIDGYNVLTSIEAALAGGVILAARDDCYRDMASLHGTWRRVAETLPAAELIGRYLHSRQPSDIVWYFDSPVSNSGRLKATLDRLSAMQQWHWDIHLVPDPDRVLRQSVAWIATADSAILDDCQEWVNLARNVIENDVPQAQVIDLSCDPSAADGC